MCDDALAHPSEESSATTPLAHGAFVVALPAKSTAPLPVCAQIPVAVVDSGTLNTTINWSAHDEHALIRVTLATVVSEIVIVSVEASDNPELTGVQSDTHKTPVPPSEYGKSSLVNATPSIFTVPSLFTSTLSCAAAGAVDALTPTYSMTRRAYPAPASSLNLATKFPCKTTSELVKSMAPAHPLVFGEPLVVVSAT